MNSIPRFIRKLRKKENSETITNPYRRKALSDNLGFYLEQMSKVKGKRVLLVGEAPGFKGCLHTGIPFSSGKLFESVPHPFIESLAPQLKIKQYVSENTAKIVWEYLLDHATVPLFWNAYPFHPHPKGQLLKNRAPTRAEVQEGTGYLKQLYELFGPEMIAGLGRKGTECAQLAFPDQHIRYIRHPSYGGKRDFIAGMNQLLN